MEAGVSCLYRIFLTVQSILMETQAVCEITVTHSMLQSLHTYATLIFPYSCLTKYIICPVNYSHHFTDEAREPQRGEIDLHRSYGAYREVCTALLVQHLLASYP